MHIPYVKTVKFGKGDTLSLSELIQQLGEEKANCVRSAEGSLRHLLYTLDLEVDKTKPSCYNKLQKKNHKPITVMGLTIHFDKNKD